MTRRLAPAITFTAAALFWLSVVLQDPAAIQRHERPAEIVVTGPIQLLLYGGDRFLAANVETTRATASAATDDAQRFRLRAHQVVSRLNPCHEDNYWVGNAALSWGGAEEQGFELLQNAMHCRYWDEWPAFFYGFNQHFFLRNLPEARRALEIAAQRSAENAAAFRTFSTMLAAGEIDDTRAALEMLRNERDKAKDPALREMLDKRVGRLEGLLLLRDAQSTYEQRFGRKLTGPQELLESGILESFPPDPTGLGYVFSDQSFQLRQMNIRY
jgi:hypothetical protein